MKKRIFYAIQLSGWNNGNTRWSIYEQDTSEDFNSIEVLWPADCEEKTAKKEGFTVWNRNTNYPKYHFHIREIGTSHTFLLREKLAHYLNATVKSQKQFDVQKDPRFELYTLNGHMPSIA